MAGRFTVTNLVAFVFFVPFRVAVAQTQPTAVQSASATPQFHGTYEELKPQQEQLIDEWYADYNKLTGDHADPKESKKSSGSFASVFQLKAPQKKSDTITLIWAKEGKYSKIVAWELEPEEAKLGVNPPISVIGVRWPRRHSLLKRK